MGTGLISTRTSHNTFNRRDANGFSERVQQLGVATKAVCNNVQSASLQIGDWTKSLNLVVFRIALVQNDLLGAPWSTYVSGISIGVAAGAGTSIGRGDGLAIHAHGAEHLLAGRCQCRYSRRSKTKVSRL